MKILCLAIGFGYVFYMCNGFLTSTPRKKPYNALFDTKVYLAHLSLAIVLAVFGFWYFRNAGFQTASFFVPTIFLTGFFMADTLVKLIAGRHLIIADRWDKKPPSYKWYIDGLMSILLIIGSLCSPFILEQYFQYRF
ncbi:hypothetical protein MON38_03875 [Hymenobacter sp. DH14]|uniref:Uncharacterized protein n=1 Tax=Hymenobacter cyanobacteriorum TaxID=2926463 RepID=A0A9X1VEC2_9BACT|nr:hypothetical protein [Hymenobacter cyanobacteriorum]MCI1186543.1 hypothetical protein [Hymenobacter cyanobacteriorum]